MVYASHVCPCLSFVFHLKLHVAFDATPSLEEGLPLSPVYQIMDE